METQLFNVTKEVITGLLPVPYAPITIGKAEVPDLFIVIDPKNVSPRLSKPESPGWRLLKKEFNLPNVFHGKEALRAWVEVRESSPETEEK